MSERPYKRDYKGKKPATETRLPYSSVYERSMIASLVMDKKDRDSYFNQLQPEDFFLTSHRTIFLALKVLYITGAPVDMATLINALEQDGTLMDIGGPALIAEMISIEYLSGQIANHFAQLRSLSNKRKLITQLSDVALGLMSGGQVSPEEYSAQLSAISVAAREIVPRPKVKDFASVANTLLERIESGEPILNGIKTGYRDYDIITGGLHGGELVLIAARPSIGKTALALNLIESLQMQGKRVGMISLEMGG